MLLKKILNEAAEVSLRDVKSPDHEVEQGEKVIGVLSDDLRRLYVLMTDAAERLESVSQKAAAWLKSFEGEERPKDEDQRRKEEFFLAENEHSTIKACFWGSVRDELPEVAGEENIGLRARWQVVVIDQRVRVKKELLELVRAIFS